MYSCDRHLNREALSPPPHTHRAALPCSCLITGQSRELGSETLTSLVKSDSGPRVTSGVDSLGSHLLSLSLALACTTEKWGYKGVHLTVGYCMLKHIQNTKEHFRVYYFLAKLCDSGLSLPICKIKTWSQIFSQKRHSNSDVPQNRQWSQMASSCLNWYFLLRDTKPISSVEFAFFPVVLTGWSCELWAEVQTGPVPMSKSG